MIINLSPYEADRIISGNFGDTEMGRDLLAQDYLLKQLTSSLMHPENELGGEFWDRVYERAYEKFGSTDIPMNTFNKIWIVPEKATVYEEGQRVYVVESGLDVMLEEDYAALQENLGKESYGLDRLPTDDTQIVNGISSEIVKEILLPEIKREVNEGKIFANLRQIYNSMVLATWYKTSLKDSLLGHVYADQSKTVGVNTQDKEINEKIWKQYVKSFKKGAYDYIREEYDSNTQEVIPRRYFSGGFKPIIKQKRINGKTDFAMLSDGIKRIVSIGVIGFGAITAFNADKFIEVRSVIAAEIEQTEDLEVLKKKLDTIFSPLFKEVWSLKAGKKRVFTDKERLAKVKEMERIAIESNNKDIMEHARGHITFLTSNEYKSIRKKVVKISDSLARLIHKDDAMMAPPFSYDDLKRIMEEISKELKNYFKDIRIKDENTTRLTKDKYIIIFNGGDDIDNHQIILAHLRRNGLINIAILDRENSGTYAQHVVDVIHKLKFTYAIKGYNAVKYNEYSIDIGVDKENERSILPGYDVESSLDLIIKDEKKRYILSDDEKRFIVAAITVEQGFEKDAVSILRGIEKVPELQPKTALRFYQGLALFRHGFNQGLENAVDTLQESLYFSEELLQRYFGDEEGVINSLEKEGFIKALRFAILDEEKGDEALLAAKPTGGINFDSAMLKLNVKRDADGAMLPMSQQDLDFGKNIIGFKPVIVDMTIMTTPLINPLILGDGNTEGSDKMDLSWQYISPVLMLSQRSRFKMCATII